MNPFAYSAFLIFLLPGLAWCVWWKGHGGLASGLADAGHLADVGHLADAIGISLAFPAIMGLGSFLFGWRFSGTAVVWMYGLLGLAVAVGVFRWVRWRDGNYQLPITNYQLSISQLIPLIVFALIVAFRFYQARDLAVPAWVDSVHHVLLVRLFLETGGVPATLAPYIQAPLVYHFGFHVNAALIAFFGRLSPDEAVLIFGQVINAFVSLVIYRLGMVLWQDWRRAVVAMLLTGFVFQMPAYYLTWGRYTLLAGLSLMILAMAAALEAVQNPRNGTSRLPGVDSVPRLAMLVSAVLLTHYFAAALLALFFAVLVLERLVFGYWLPWKIWEEVGFRRLFVAGVIGTLLAAPWLGWVWRGANAYFGVGTVSPTQPLDEVYFSGYLEYLWFLLGPYRSHVMLVIGLTALILVGWQDRTRPLGLWAVVFGLLSLPWGVHVRPFRPDHGVIVAFFPASMLVADAFITPLDASSRRWFKRLAEGVLGVALVSVLVWGVKETKDIVNPVTVLVAPEEIQAIQWIGQNTPEDARFFINVTYWQSGSYRGVDGGWWIMPLTGRDTFLPPVLYLFGRVDDAIAINTLAERAAQFNGCTEEFQAFLKEHAITHVYLGPNQGSLRPESLGNCPGLQEIYSVNGVTIYEVSFK